MGVQRSRPGTDRQRRGVRGPGPASRGPDGCPAPGHLPRRRERPGRRARASRPGTSAAADRRLGPDHRHRRGRGHRGGVSQVRAVAAALTAVAKERNMACVLVGTSPRTRDRRPRVLEHLVDVVLQFEGDRHSSLRTIRGVKKRTARQTRSAASRWCPTASSGWPIRPASSCPAPHTGARNLRDGHPAGPPGAAGRLPNTDYPEHRRRSRRTVSGLESARAAMVIAVLQRWSGVASAARRSSPQPSVEPG